MPFIMKAAALFSTLLIAVTAATIHLQQFSNPVIRAGNALPHAPRDTVGFANETIDGSDLCQLTECELGDLVCDALLAYAGPKTGAKVCITNGDSINASIEAGDITRSELAKAIPFPDLVVILQIPGSTLLAAIEQGLTALGNSVRGQFPQIGGMGLVVKYDGPVGSRISSLKVGTADVVPSGTYVLVTNSFLADGGANFSWPGYKNLTGKSVSLMSVVENYLRSHQPYVPPRLDRINNTVIGKASAPIAGDVASCGIAECQVANLVCDALLAYTGSSLGAQVCITNGGSVSRPIDAGDITNVELSSSLPFSNTAVTLKISGKTLISALETGFSGVGGSTPADGFPQVGGMEVTYDSSKPKGQRVLTVKIRGSSVVPSKEYVLVTNSFLANGGDGYSWPGSITLAGGRLNVNIVVEKYLSMNIPYQPAKLGRIVDSRKH